MTEIFTLTVVRPHDAQHDRSPRTWTWFPTFEEAEKSLFDNTEFFFEIGYYRYCVIECIKSMDLGPHDNVVWYSVEYLGQDEVTRKTSYKITKLDESPFPGIVNWSLG